MTPQNPFPAVLGLTLGESRILMCILASAPEAISREDIHATIYARSKSAPNNKIIGVQIHYMRKKLAPFKIVIPNASGRGYFLSQEDAGKLNAWLIRKPQKLYGDLDPIPVALIIAYFGERDRSAHAITKMLDGEVSLDAVKQALSRARKAGRDIPTFYGGRANRPAMQVGA